MSVVGFCVSWYSMRIGSFSCCLATIYPIAKDSKEVKITPATSIISAWWVLTNWIIFDNIFYMAKTKATGATKLGRDSQPKYLGVKLYEGQKAKIGQILIRQRGSKFLPGKNVRRGSDDTLYASKEGVVRFGTKRKIGFDNKQRIVKTVNIESR